MTGGTELAHHPSFYIGDVEVRPASLELIGAGGSERIEPLVMRVLVVLAEATGVVSRDELVARCWAGRIVGDDAINRVIGRIRRLSEGAAKDSFIVETIPRVGYRLVRAGSRHKRRRGRPGAPKILIAAVGLVLLGGAILAWTIAPSNSTSAQYAKSDLASLVATDPEARGRAALFENSTAQLDRAITYLRKATVDHPERASSWAGLALAYAHTASRMPPRPRGPSWEFLSRQAARRALMLDKQNGDALATIAMLEPTFRNWARKDGQLRRALSSVPNHPDVLLQRARFLAHVGRTAEALAISEQVSKFYPLVPWVQRGHITLLAASGRVKEAEALAEHTSELWPEDRTLWLDRVLLLALHGAPSRAEGLVAASGLDTHLADNPGLRQAIEALSSLPSEDNRAVARYFADRATQASLNPSVAIRTIAGLGEVEMAMQLAEAIYTSPDGPRLSEHNAPPLFTPPGDRLWNHPRFMTLMQEIGLVDFWRATGRPDLCAKPALRKACGRHGL